MKNTVELKGNLSTDVTYNHNDDESKQRAWFVVAVDRYGENAGADFIPITVFGKTAKACADHLYKGKEVGVEGRVNTWRPIDKETGEPGKSQLQIIARPGGIEFGRDPKGKGKKGNEATDVASVVANTILSLVKAGVVDPSKLPTEYSAPTPVEEAEESEEAADLPDLPL